MAPGSSTFADAPEDAGAGTKQKVLPEMSLILGLAAPIFVSIGAYVVVEVMQVALLGHVSTESLSAAVVALAWVDILKVFLTTGAVGTLCSQAYGAGEFELVGVWLQVALVVGLIISAPVMVLSLCPGPFLHAVFGFEGQMLADAQSYARLCSLVVIPQMAWERVTRYFTSIQIVTPETLVAIIGMLFYLLAAYVLIFGVSAWSGLGFLGAPLAWAGTTILQNVVLYVYAVRWKQYHKQTWPGWRCFRYITRRRISVYLRLYVPGVLQAGSELWRMQLLNLWSAVLGETEVAAQAAAFRIIYLVYIFVYSLSLATTTRVGTHLGAGLPWHARGSARIGVLAAAMCAAGMGVAIIVFQRALSAVFTTDPEVLIALDSISHLIAGSQFFMTMADVFNPILNAQGRPTMAAVASTATSWLLHVPFCWLLAFYYKRGLTGMWEGILLGYIGQGVLSGLFVLFSPWERLAREAQERCKLSRTLSDSGPRSGDCIGEAGDLGVGLQGAGLVASSAP